MRIMIKFISSQRSLIFPAVTVKELCRSRVTADGRAIKKPDTQIDESRAEIYVDGEKISYRKYLYIMLNKPQGVVCSTRDGVSQTVLEIIPEEYRRTGMFPAGRLDKDTEGFVLLTDDGELAHKMLSPKSHVPKTYFVRLEKPWEESYREAFAAGMTIDGNEKCLPAEFSGSDDAFECT